jgi:hypothetical protein
MTQEITQIQFVVSEQEEPLTPYQMGKEDALMELPRQAYDYFVPESTQWYEYMDGYAAGQAQLQQERQGALSEDEFMSQILDELRNGKRAFIITMTPAEHDAIERDRMMNRWR